MAKFNLGSWGIALVIGGLGYATVLQDMDWDFRAIPTREQYIDHGLFAAPALFLMILAFVVPIILNPWILGWPFLRQGKKLKPISSVPEPKRTGSPSARTLNTARMESDSKVVGLNKFITHTSALDSAIERAMNKPDVELGSLATKELGSAGGPSTVATHQKQQQNQVMLQKQQKQREDEFLRAQGINVGGGNKPPTTNNQPPVRTIVASTPQQQHQQQVRRDSRGGGNNGSNHGKSNGANNGGGGHARNSSRDTNSRGYA